MHRQNGQRNRIFITGALVSLLLGVTPRPAQAVGTRHFVLETEKDFAAGKLESVSVDSSGRLRPGLDKQRIEISLAASAWDAALVGGALFVATGNEGKLLRVKDGKVTEVAERKALALTSIVSAFGRIIVAAIPGGELFELKGSELVGFAKLEGAEHVWALAYDAEKQALYAATGPDGKLYRVLADGTAQVYFDSDQPHLVSLAVSKSGVLAGSSGKARLYRVSAPGRAQVLHDFESTEVRAIAVGASGDVFAIANELKDGDRGSAASATRPAAPVKSTPKKGKGALLRFGADGVAEQLYASSDDHFASLSLGRGETVLVGTGGEGRVIAVSPDHESTILLDVDERQVSRILLDGDKGYVVASDAVAVYDVRGVGGDASVWTSQVLDAGLRAHFGRMTWDATGPVLLSTRSGNTSEPDDTWSDWSRDLDKPTALETPPGRYFQVRVRLAAGSSTSLRRIDVPFVTDNQRPVLTRIEAKFAARVAATGTGAVKSGTPIDGTPKPTIEVDFKVDNPDQDELRYYVEYRPVAGTRWFDALEPGKVLTRSEFTWKTDDIPEGAYVLRVTASDEPSNPPSRAKKHSLESNVILVDNTAPSFENVVVRGRHVELRARDLVGPIRRLEARLVGREEWIPFEPTDGIFDEPSEDFVLDLSQLSPSGPELVTIRVFDTAGNSDVRHVRLGE